MKIIDNLKQGNEILKTNNISSYKIDCEILSSYKFRKKYQRRGKRKIFKSC